eukprot:m.114325 g.114325  ORF g.114325 m.114325 type:complete len:162 (+) comp17117_c0_seq11:1037-1522(+)
MEWNCAKLIWCTFIPIDGAEMICLCVAGADGNGSLQGAGKEQTCSAGFFCPNQTAQQTCPANHFCQEGVDVPHTCNAFTICKTGTGSPSLNFTGAVMVSIIAGGLMLVLGLYENRRFWHKVFDMGERWCRKHTLVFVQKPTAICVNVWCDAFACGSGGDVH